MSVEIAVASSLDADPLIAFEEAARTVADQLGGAPDLCVAFSGGSHLLQAEAALDCIHERLAPRALIGCGAGGVVAGGREVEDGHAAVVWAARMPGATITTHELDGEQGSEPEQIEGLPEPEVPADVIIVLADPYTFAADSLLSRLNEERPGTPVLGGLASASVGGTSRLFIGDEVLSRGAVAVAISGVEVLPCVSQGAMPVGPEIAITEADENVIHQLAFKPAMERIGEVVTALPAEERRAAVGGMLVGVTIDENQPEHERGDFIVRPIVGADRESGAIAIGERVRVGQTIRLHVRDAASADADLREALAAQVGALGEGGPAGALLFTCNGRGSNMFDTSDHDATAIEEALGVPCAGFFAAGEIGPVGGRNFLHGFTATLAVFGREGR